MAEVYKELDYYKAKADEGRLQRKTNLVIVTLQEEKAIYERELGQLKEKNSKLTAENHKLKQNISELTGDANILKKKLKQVTMQRKLIFAALQESDSNRAIPAPKTPPQAPQPESLTSE